jgi:hypothetical protein
MFKTVLIFLAMTGMAAAQASVAVDVGVRGGLTTNAFERTSSCCGLNPFVTESSNDESKPATLGATVSLRLYDRIGVRFEAVRQSIGYRSACMHLQASWETQQSSREAIRGNIRYF